MITKEVVFFFFFVSFGCCVFGSKPQSAVGSVSCIGRLKDFLNPPSTEDAEVEQIRLAAGCRKNEARWLHKVMSGSYSAGNCDVQTIQTGSPSGSILRLQYKFENESFLKYFYCWRRHQVLYTHSNGFLVIEFLYGKRAVPAGVKDAKVEFMKVSVRDKMIPKESKKIGWLRK